VLHSRKIAWLGLLGPFALSFAPLTLILGMAPCILKNKLVVSPSRASYLVRLARSLATKSTVMQHTDSMLFGSIEHLDEGTQW
jgi:hypothetical protein